MEISKEKKNNTTTRIGNTHSDGNSENRDNV